MRKNLLFTLSLLAFGMFFVKNVFALEEISFPDVTYVVTDSGKWIEKNIYMASIESKNDSNKDLKDEKYVVDKAIFPDITYVILNTGEWIEEGVYEKSLIKNEIINGYATYYGDPRSGKFHGKATASGEIFNRDLMTAAMNNIELGTIVKVTNIANNKFVIVKVNDRMGSVKNKIDLSYGAFKKIAHIKTGRVLVDIEIIK